MRKGIYIAWGAWALIGIALKIMGLIPWLWATSALWFPLLVVLSFLGVLLLVGDIGARLKRRAEEKIPDSCENCLFGSTCDLLNTMKEEGEEKQKCIGEKHGYERGELCEYYIRSKKADTTSYNPLRRE